MRFFLLIAFFALIAVVVATMTGAQHGQHGGAKHDVPQGGLAVNATHLPLNSTSSANVTITEPTASATETNTTVVSSSST